MSITVYYSFYLFIIRQWVTNNERHSHGGGTKSQDFLIQGLNQYEIADILKVSQPTINNDVQFLREKASEIMQNHIQDVLPAEFQNCLAGINRILKMTWQIANNADNNSYEVVSSKVEDKIKLQALALANECYKYKMDLGNKQGVFNKRCN